MLLGILSDSHDELSTTRRAVALLQQQGAEVLIHCGDLTGAEVVEICSALPCYIAFGNHDADNLPELEHALSKPNRTSLGDGAIIRLGGKRIAIVHGHMGMRKMLDEQPDILLHGHTHTPTDTQNAGVRRICPGALHRIERPTVAMLNTDSEQLRFFDLADG